ncbi:MAG: 1-acyl-sn-glycerol-3-phosphate acyltransferase [Ruminococcaceae bacterium]|nr:1-acyl-sn-glycerol-3-phosphate acyltransferase [Oscillospiraceae bacterium]
MFYTIAHTAVNILWHLWFRLELRGTENVPKNGPFVFCSNHVSGLDPTIVCLGVPTRIKLRFIGKAELFKNPFLRILFVNGLGCFPIERGTADMGALDKAINIVKDGGALAIFPEGTRSKDGYLQRFKSGLSLIVQQTKADVLPCNVTYLDGKKFRGRVVVNYGPVIPFETLGFSDTQSPRELKGATRIICSKVEELSLLPPKPEESED